MPHRKNAKGDIGGLKRFSDTYDMDNVYLSEEGWVYRHFKKADKSVWWDEILVAGQVKEDEVIHGVDNSPLCLTNPDKLGVKSDPTMEVGDGNMDIEYSDHVGGPDKITTFAVDGTVVGKPLSDRYDYQETAWSSINVPAGTVYKNPDDTQVPLGWSGVSSPAMEPPYITPDVDNPPVAPDPTPPANENPGVPVQQDE